MLTSPQPLPTAAKLIPSFRYHDAKAAIDFLCRAFGFQPRNVVESPDGFIGHAELTYGPTMIMLGAARDDTFAELLGTAQTQGKPTTCLYLVVLDVDAHHAQAVAAGARVLMPLTDKPYGSREYVCADLEGNLWSFGTYDPWASLTT